MFSSLVSSHRKYFLLSSKLYPKHYSSITTIPNSPYYLEKCDRTEECECKYGFKRKEFKSPELIEKMKKQGLTHDKHFFISTKIAAKNWPPEVNDLETVNKFQNSLIQLKQSLPFKSPRVTLMESKSVSPQQSLQQENTFDLLVFPEGVSFPNISVENLNSFLQSAFIAKDMQGSTLPYNTFVFICAHEQRDKRCGYTASILLDTFYHQLQAYGLLDQVFLGRTSHVGGHAFAGNVIVFQKDEATQLFKSDWYAFVDEKAVETIITQHIMGKQIVTDLYRGSMLL